MHVPPSGPVNPALQVHMLFALHPLHDAPELVGHARHAAADVAASVEEYVPDPQFVHAAEPVALL